MGDIYGIKNKNAALSMNKPSGSSNIKRAIEQNICAYGFKWGY